ncbi:MAG: c-type cytochrome domain-containing protein [Verrucomicrobiota bacterium]
MKTLNNKVVWAGLIALLCLVLVPVAQAAVAAKGAEEGFSWIKFLAPFHTVVLHMPIGFMTTVLILEAYSFWRPAEALKGVVRLVLIMTVLSSAVSAALGWMRGQGGDYDPTTLERHQWAGISFAVATLVTTGLNFLLNKGKAVRGVYYASIGLCMGVMTIAGHLGGNLTHGSSYLTENAPTFIKNIVDKKADAPVLAEPKDEAAKYYVEQIKPIFEAKCFSCHGPEKQKGGLRLDERKAVLTGGDSGEPAVKLDDPAASYLLRLVMMPPDHDDVMPPAGKGTVSEEEIMKIIRWIRNGAAYPETVAAPVKAEAK